AIFRRLYYKTSPVPNRVDVTSRMRSMLTDSRREKRNLVLAWLDIREAFPSVSHHLMLFLMERLGLSGALLRVVQDTYSDATIAVRTGRDSYTANIPQRNDLSPVMKEMTPRGSLSGSLGPSVRKGLANW
ncbi:hypothetical protein EMCRGX_G006658, partial [Ephydatia muelleri]